MSATKYLWRLLKVDGLPLTIKNDRILRAGTGGKWCGKNIKSKNWCASIEGWLQGMEGTLKRES